MSGNIKKYSFEFVKKYLLDRNIELLCTEYRTNKTSMSCKCVVCDNLFNPIFYNIKNHNTGCSKCGMKIKAKNTFLKNYGVTNPNKLRKVRRKIEKTCRKLYGVSVPAKSLKIREKMEKTCLERYGVNIPAKNKDIALRCALSANQITILKHWFSCEGVNCRAGYEIAVVEYLNKNQIDYNFQPQTFLMPNDRTYTPDMYLPDRDLWIEIKGYKRPDAMKKWRWFHKEYPNSELWDEKKLKKMEIL